MRRLLFGLVFLAPLSARAQLTITYKGSEHRDGKAVPVMTQYSVQDGRVAAIMRGEKTARVLYLSKEQVLRVINESDKSYVDLDQGTVDQMTSMVADMRKQLEQLPAAQRAMAESMMKNAMGGTKPAIAYTWSNETQRVAGYECRLATGMRGEEKVTEYCASKAPEFRMTADERRTVQDMQSFLSSFTSIMRSGDDNTTNAFAWDATGDGYPVLSRSFKDGKVTLELQLDRISRERVADSLFTVPEGYRKLEMPGGGRRR
ncbi:MAG: hypothetical protein MNPFHGCM_00247 [Gemmatimonadaceae bacterium]|nr:hypothetical protein [Gemmatimonadaceae bacterium]